MSQSEHLLEYIPVEMGGMRLDQVLARLFPDYSRSRLQEWVREGRVKVDGKALRPRDKVIGGERVELTAEARTEVSWQPQAMALDIVYEDESILVINKPPGLVVHPAAGNPDRTLLNALLHHAPELCEVPRAGIVHRLDKDTSGLMVVARTLKAQTALVAQLQQRTVGREYAAVVVGHVVAGGTIDAPIGRHPTARTRMAVRDDGRPAVTHYRVNEHFSGHTYLRVKLETGRTHQIRVHMAYIHHPLVGDPVYGGRLRIPKGASEPLIQALRGFDRQALHAGRLGLSHPEKGEWMEWEAPLPSDMTALLESLRWDAHEVNKERKI